MDCLWLLIYIAKFPLRRTQIFTPHPQDLREVLHLMWYYLLIEPVRNPNYSNSPPSENRLKLSRKVASDAFKNVRENMWGMKADTSRENRKTNIHIKIK